jgi:PPOX class probable F420-dependent enzyme
MEIAKALEMIASGGPGVLGTIAADGRPHLSVVTGVVVEGSVWISLTADRVKAKNLRRDPRATFLHGLGPWAAVEGTVRFHEGDDVLERLRLYYRTARGEHPDWDDYDRAMREEHRFIAELVPERAYGLTP